MEKFATVYLDLTKAFDIVNHNILLNKMNHIRIPGSTLAFFTLYLKNSKKLMILLITS